MAAVKLHLGILDVPYTDADGITTGDVAEILEEKYGLLGDGFVPAHAEDIAQVMAESVQASLEALVAGVTVHPFAAGCSQISSMMKRFLTTQEAERVGLPGVPTAAALAGVNKRLKTKRGARRPSFIDSSEMVSSYVAWVDAEEGVVSQADADASQSSSVP